MSTLTVHKYASCNTIGSYISIISDINECLNGKGNCTLPLQCFNTDGSYLCQCAPGYVYDADNMTCNGELLFILCNVIISCTFQKQILMNVQYPMETVHKYALTLLEVLHVHAAQGTCLDLMQETAVVRIVIG